MIFSKAFRKKFPMFSYNDSYGAQDIIFECEKIGYGFQIFSGWVIPYSLFFVDLLVVAKHYTDIDLKSEIKSFIEEWNKKYPKPSLVEKSEKKNFKSFPDIKIPTRELKQNFQEGKLFYWEKEDRGYNQTVLQTEKSIEWSASYGNVKLSGSVSYQKANSVNYILNDTFNILESLESGNISI